ncbi:DUF3494 domain-containing protein [Marivirga sp. S37H4]|uniref:DUF3494 domain-containing protein n=1 Tax=Marivirga aurantiaca TaxID=2802615 RepID=A0A935CDA4_9BACT|nr:ice-binding family protein [Marivirga aurantiaca]MBK6266713.1 DUF3494 domain-containing protein [Marivirga aurantiaca]
MMLFTKSITIFTIAAAILFTACNEKEDVGVRPSVLSTDPISEASGIAINHIITATFSEEMDGSTNTKFSLRQGTVEVNGTTAYNNLTASFTPENELLPNTLYTAVINQSATSLTGSSMWEDYTWDFTTGELPDNTAPTITLSDPENDAINVELNTTIVFTFSEPMDQSTFNASTFEVKQGESVIAGEITTDATTATFTPWENLEGNMTYTATISTGVKDTAGNALLADKIISFTTAEAPDTSVPRVNATEPMDNATEVVRNKTISVTFNEEMDIETINNSSFTLEQGNNSISGTVTYNNEIAIFTPDALLEAGLTYTASISTDAKDLAGNALAANTEWSFTTVETSSVLATVDLGSSANYVILAKSTITNVPTSAITGDLGLSPAATSLITGFDLVDATGYATSTQVAGYKVYAADMASPTPTNLTVAVEDMMLAYTDAAGRPTPDFLELATGSIGGLTLSPGLYKWTTTVTISDDVVINGGADDIWIFQISGDLSMSSAKNITLTGGAQAKNIFWQVAGSATIGTNSSFQGIILSMNDAIFQTEATLFGRALAQKAVILDKNIVTKPE